MRISDWSSDVCSSDLTKMWWLLALVMFAYTAFLGAVLGFSLTQSTAPTGPGMGGGGVPSGLESAQATYTVGASLGYVFPLIVGSSEERRVGKGCVSTGRSRWAPYH